MDRHETYTELLRDHSALIWSMCRNTAPGDYERCRDLFQDVSLRLWQHYDELRSDAKPHERKAWVEWQVRHVLNHAGRRERPVPMSDLPEQPDIDALDKAEIRTLVNDLLTQLNPDERQMLQMRMDGYSAGEIAKEMGLSRDTVYQRMHRTLTKARRILLVLFLLFMASSITVAVVPSWRQKVFGGGNPSATDTTPSSTAIPSTPVPAPVANSTADSIPAHRAWVPTQPIQHLVAAADTSLPMPLPTLDEPCGCPQGYQRKTQTDSLDTLDDPCEPIPDELPPATIRVVGNTIVVEDVMNELVDIYDTRGRLVATAHCDGRCAISFRIEQNYPRDRSTTTHVLWVHVGNRPRQRVIIEDQRNDSPRVYVR